MLNGRLTNHVSHVELAQNFRRPNAMTPAFAHRCVADPHELSVRRDRRFAVDE